jgi:peptidoglycan/LPS O-acetylase OafA/YrhL
MLKAHPHLSHPKYRPDIDGLRAVAVLSVVAFHAFPSWIPGGFIGVDIFFVISGFLITTIILENLENDTFSFGEFYVRRVRRIFPALILVLVASLAFGWLILLADELNQLGKHVAAGAGFVSNLVLWGEAGYFDSAAETKPLLHLWSLGIEEQFYIVWPLALWFAWKSKGNVFTLTVVVAIASFYLNIRETQQDAVAAFYSPQTRFWELACGSMLACLTLRSSISDGGLKARIGRWLLNAGAQQEVWVSRRVVSNVASLAGVLLLVCGFWAINKSVSFPGKWAAVPVVGAALIILAGPAAWINKSILGSRVAVWFGLISFPLYLWHWPLLCFSRIFEDGEPSRGMRVTAALLSVLLAWLTVRWVEKPLRSSNKKVRLKFSALCVLVVVIGVIGLIVGSADFSRSRNFEQLTLKRKGSEHAFGTSRAWYQGKNDWLFLGNAYEETVAKIKLAIVPSDDQIEATKTTISKVAAAASKHGARVVLIVGPDKPSIYPEHLPDRLVPSRKKYIGFFLDRLRDIPNLTVYDPTEDLLRFKQTEGLLYWMTDTHWNNKGAFLTYAGFSQRLGLPVPSVEFITGPAHSGDLIAISKLKEFTLHPEDNWVVVWRKKPVLTEKQIRDEDKTAFGSASVVTNETPLANNYVWVVGDSFTSALKQYFNATFKEVRYVGHWSKKLTELPLELDDADRKPDLVVIIRVERSF